MRELNEQELEQVVGGATISAFGGIATGEAEATGNNITFSHSHTHAYINTTTGVSAASASNTSFATSDNTSEVSSFAASGTFLASF